jgi:defect-in-organelle-trafficking protein DotB
MFNHPFTPLPDDPVPYRMEGTMSMEILDEILSYAEKVGAGEINFMSGQIVRVGLHGVNRPFTNRAISHPEVERVLKYMFSEQGPSLLNGGNDIDGSHELRAQSGIRDYPLRFRYNATKGRDAINISMRTLPSEPPSLATMNVPELIISNLRPKSGLIYVAGPTGSGKSTLMAACIRYLVQLPDRPEDGFINSGKIIFYERPIEFIYDDLKDLPRFIIHQAEIGKDLRARGDRPSESEEWAYAVRNALRRTPDMAVIGEARDPATILGCINLALSGHLTWATIHAIGVSETIRRATIVFPAAERQGAAVDLLNTLHMIVAQILVPKIGGGRQALREYGLFNQDVKSKLLRVPVDSWPETVRDLMKSGVLVGETLLQCADRRLADGLITKETRDMAAARQEEGLKDAEKEAPIVS